jgi:hypothetical protein
MKGRMYLVVDDGDVLIQAFVVRTGKHLHCYSYTPDKTDHVIERIMDHGLRADYPLTPRLADEVITAMEDFRSQHSESTWLP